MALWGNKDSVYAVGVVTVSYDNLTVTGSGDFVAGGVAAGDVIQIGVGSTFGEAVITSVSSASTISIASTQFLSGGEISGAAYNINQQPKYALGVGQTYRGSTNPSVVYGVDGIEVGAASTTPYAVTHSGWVSIGATYIDSEGNLRVKHEVLVAGGIVPPDASDDTLFPDPTISILTDVVDAVGVATDGNATFSVVTSVSPDYAPLTYQWREDGSNLSDGGDYSGATTSILTVVNDSDKDDGREYDVVITSGDTSVTSGVGTITYA